MGGFHRRGANRLACLGWGELAVVWMQPNEIHVREFSLTWKSSQPWYLL